MSVTNLTPQPSFCSEASVHWLVNVCGSRSRRQTYQGEALLAEVLLKEDYHDLGNRFYSFTGVVCYSRQVVYYTERSLNSCPGPAQYRSPNPAKSWGTGEIE